MDRKLNPNELELHKRCDEVLQYMWDPLGVAGTPEARDEYDSYLPLVFGLLREGANGDAIAEYLRTVEHRQMGLHSNGAQAAIAADALYAWHHHLLR